MNIQLIETLYRQSKLTQKEIADLLGFSSASIFNNILKGKRKLRAEELKKLSELFGVSMDTLAS